MTRIIGKGDAGNFLVTTWKPDSTFKSEITSLISSGTDIVGKLVQIATSDDYTVTSPAASADPDGEIIAYEKDGAGDDYRLTCQIWGYTDMDSAHHDAHGIKKFRASGTPALGKFIKVTGGTYKEVREAATAGVGKIVRTESGSCDVLI